MLVSTVVFCAALVGRARCGCAPAGRVGGGGRALKVLVVSGIWPPDVGGPASHAPEVAAFLRARGHDGRGRDHRRRGAGAGGLPGALGAPLAAARRPPRRDGAAARRRSRAAPTSSTRPGCSAARRSARCSARTPFVTKLTADPAYERARRWGLRRGSLEEFQRAPRRARRCRSGSRATSTCAAPRTSSRRRRTCASSRSAGASRRTG